MDRAPRSDHGTTGPFQGLFEFATPRPFAERDRNEGSGQVFRHRLADAGRVPIEHCAHQGVPDRVVFVVPGGVELFDQLRAGHQPLARRSALGHPGRKRRVVQVALDPHQLVGVPVPPAHYGHAVSIREGVAERVAVVTAGRQRSQLGLPDRGDDERTSVSQPIKGVRSPCLVVSLEVVEPDESPSPVLDTEVFETGQTPGSRGKQEAATHLLANRFGRGARFASGRAADDQDDSAFVLSGDEGGPQCGVAVALDVVEVGGLTRYVGASNSEGAEVSVGDPEWGSVSAEAGLLQHVSEALRVSDLDVGRSAEDLSEGSGKGRRVAKRLGYRDDREPALFVLVLFVRGFDDHAGDAAVGEHDSSARDALPSRCRLRMGDVDVEGHHTPGLVRGRRALRHGGGQQRSHGLLGLVDQVDGVTAARAQESDVREADRLAAGFLGGAEGDKGGGRALGRRPVLVPGLVHDEKCEVPVGVLPGDLHRRPGGGHGARTDNSSHDIVLATRVFDNVAGGQDPVVPEDDARTRPSGLGPHLCQAVGPESRHCPIASVTRPWLVGVHVQGGAVALLVVEARSQGEHPGPGDACTRASRRTGLEVVPAHSAPDHGVPAQLGLGDRVTSFTSNRILRPSPFSRASSRPSRSDSGARASVVWFSATFTSSVPSVIVTNERIQRHCHGRRQGKRESQLRDVQGRSPDRARALEPPA